MSDVATVIQLAQQDKKNKGGELRFSLLNGLGSCGFDIKVTPNEIQQAAEYYVG